MPAAVTSALTTWPPEMSGSSAGISTNPASSAGPTRSGTDSARRPRRRLAIARLPSRIASPPASESAFAHSGQSSLTAPRSWTPNTSASSGTARVKMSS